MPEYCLPTSFSWSGSQEEDRRFRRIFGAVLVPFFVVGYIVPHLSVPRIEVAPEEDPPRRIVRIIEERVEPAAVISPAARLTTRKPGAAPRAARDTVPILTPRAEKESTKTADRARAARSGLLAASSTLSQLQNVLPTIAVPQPGANAIPNETRSELRRPSLLNRNVGEGSVGLSGEIVAHRSILRASRLERLELTSPGNNVEGSGSVRKAGGSGETERRHVRSEDDIQEILSRKKSEIYMLYNRELTKDPTLKGKVVVSLTIAPSGQVTDCRIVFSELNAASLERELILLIRNIDFGAKPGVPVVSTRVPIEFFPV